MSTQKLTIKSIRLNEKEYQKLSAIASSKGATAAGVIRVMIKQYLEQAELTT